MGLLVLDFCRFLFRYELHYKPTFKTIFIIVVTVFIMGSSGLKENGETVSDRSEPKKELFIEIISTEGFYHF